VPPRTSLVEPGRRTSTLNDFASGVSPSNSQTRNNDPNEPPVPLIGGYNTILSDPLYYENGSTVAPRQDETPRMDIHSSYPLADEYNTTSPVNTNLATHGYNTLFQSTFDTFIDPLEEPTETEELRRDIDAPVQRTLLLPDAAYPEYIHDTMAYVSDLPLARRNFYPLWNYLLEYWFPSTQGFEIIQGWDPKTSSFDALPSRPKPSYAVFDAVSPTEPFLFVHIHNTMPVNDFSRRQAKITMGETFETLRACSFCAGFKTLCVVSAIGARWGMVARDPGWLESENRGGGDCVGEWEEDVTSPESYRVMGYCFEEMKKDVLRRRRD